MDTFSQYFKTSPLSAHVLFSSSKGNCIFVTNGETSLLVDAGRTVKDITAGLEKIGRRVSDVNAIFVTHEHTDHVSAVSAFARINQIPVHIKKESVCGLKRPGAVHCVEYDGRIVADVGDIHIESFATPHDSRASVGYIISSKGVKIGIATDLGHVSNEVFTSLYGSDAIILESNYDFDMLNNGKYPFPLKQRIHSDTGHLSNGDCAWVLPLLFRGGTRRFVLAHLSQENNRPKLAYEAAVRSFDENNLYCGYLKVADKSRVTKLI